MVPTNHPFPKADSIRRVIADLLGREVTVTPGDALVLERATPAVVSDYVTADGRIAAMCITDLRLSNALGAALTMVSVRHVDDAVKQRVVDHQNLDNLAEIVNIMARLFNSADCALLEWNRAHALPGDVPDATTALLKAPRARRDYDVTLEEYGSGKLAILVG